MMIMIIMAMTMQTLMAGPVPEDSPYGPPVEPGRAPETIGKAVASLPPEQMFQLMQQIKTCIQNNPHEARTMLLQNPQLAYAVLQAQVVMKIVDPETAITMLHKPQAPAPPVGVGYGARPSSLTSSGPPNFGPPFSGGAGPGPGSYMGGMEMGGMEMAWRLTIQDGSLLPRFSKARRLKPFRGLQACQQNKIDRAISE